MFAGTTVWQSFSAFWWFERLFNELQPTSVFELGTLNGGLTAFFGMCFPNHVVTVDLADCVTPKTADLLNRLGIRRLAVDILNDTAGVLRAHLDQTSKPRFIFCDNGDKPREFAMFAPYMEVGDAIAIHDVGAEFFPDRPETQQIAAACGLERLYADEMLADGTLLAAYKKVR